MMHCYPVEVFFAPGSCVCVSISLRHLLFITVASPVRNRGEGSIPGCSVSLSRVHINSTTVMNSHLFPGQMLLYHMALMFYVCDMCRIPLASALNSSTSDTKKPPQWTRLALSKAASLCLGVFSTRRRTLTSVTLYCAAFDSCCYRLMSCGGL